MRSVIYDRRWHLHADLNSFLWRAVLRIGERLWRRRLGSEWDRRQRLLLVAAVIAAWLTRPSVVVLHTTKMRLLLTLKWLLPRSRVVAYHHNSEGHLAEPELLRAVGAGIDGHVFVCRHAEALFRQTMERLLPGLELHSAVVYNGVDLSRFRPDSERRRVLRANAKVRDDQVVLLFAGRLIPRKGLDKVLAALAILSPHLRSSAVLWIAGGLDYGVEGDSDYVRGLRAMISELGLEDQVCFFGYLPHEKMPDLYCASDILVFPSTEPEGMPLAIIEAMGCGLPVVASAVGGVPEAVSDGLSGFLVRPPGDPSAIARSVAALISDPVLRGRMGTCARRIAEERFSREQMAKHLLAFIGQLSSRNPRPAPCPVVSLDRKNLDRKNREGDIISDAANSR
jgi:glycosyltransferase involved in cell wall biosynthesis